MKKFLLLLILNSAFNILNLYAQSPNWQWAKSAGGFGCSIATDSSGSSYVIGFFLGPSITFDTITLTNANLQSCDIFIAKYDAGGNVVWAKSAGGTGDDYGYSIAVDDSGNCYITGNFGSPSITFGTITLTNSGSSGFYLVKYDAGGNVMWAKGAGGTGDGRGNSIAVDESGCCYVTGYFNSPSITFGATTLTNSGSSEFFLVKYDAGGNAMWAASAGGTGEDKGNSIAVDGSGNSFVTGNFNSSSITFGTTTLTNAGGEDIFIVKFDAGGNSMWAKSAGGTLEDKGNSIAVDGSGNSYFTGSFESPSITFGTTTLTNAGFNNIFLVKYDAGGNVVWAKREGGIYQDYGYSIAVDGSGSSYVSGSFNSPSITFGTTTLTNVSTTFTDIFIVKYDTGGNIMWAKSAGGISEDEGYSIAIDGSSNCYVTGSFASTSITFGSTTINLVTGWSMYVSKLASTITQVEELEDGAGVSVFPNPARDRLEIRNYKSEITGVEIYDALGQLRLLPTLFKRGHAITLCISGLPQGIYVARIKTGEKLHARKIIIE